MRKGGSQFFWKGIFGRRVRSWKYKDTTRSFHTFVKNIYMWKYTKVWGSGWVVGFEERWAFEFGAFLSYCLVSSIQKAAPLLRFPKRGPPERTWRLILFQPYFWLGVYKWWKFLQESFHRGQSSLWVKSLRDVFSLMCQSWAKSLAIPLRYNIVTLKELS